MTDTATAAPETAEDKPHWPLSDNERANTQTILDLLNKVQETTGGWRDKAECRLTGVSYYVTFGKKVPDIQDSMDFMKVLGIAPALLNTCCSLLLAAAKEHDDRAALRESLGRVVHNLDQFMSDHPDPGTEAFGAVYEANALLGRSKPQTTRGSHPEFGVIYHRKWSAPVRNPNGSTTFTVRRACNGCGALIGDTTVAEIETSIAGDELPDVTSECPFCNP